MKNYLIQPLKIFFSVTSHVMPFVAIRVADKLFTTPFHSKQRDDEKEILEHAERFSIPMEKRKPLAGYRWGDKSGPIILLVHGWTATATCFVNFIDPLLARGYQVVSYDSIAHGETSGVSVSMTEWADTLISVMENVGQVHAIVGHSLGAGATVIASTLKLDTDKIVLISPVTDIVKVSNQFAHALSIPAQTIEKVRQYAWRKYHTSASKYGTSWQDVFSSDFKVPTLIIHDKDDKEIEIEHGRWLARQWPWADYIETEQLGHRRILLNPLVIESVTSFIQKPVTCEGMDRF
jgi:pimeloyl-ACP methyl ester carboxylesterase